MYNTADVRASEFVSAVKKIANEASGKFDNAQRSVNVKASDRIDLFGNDAVKRVADIAGDMRKASDEYYSSLQSLIVELDMKCKPLLEEGLTVDGIYEVYSAIKWLNEESEIENNFNATVNSTDLGGIANVTYFPSMENKMIQQFWYNKFSMTEGSDAVLAREREKELENKKRKAQAKQMIADIMKSDREQVSIIEGEPVNSATASPEDAALNEKKDMLEKWLGKLKREYNREKKLFDEKMTSYKADSEAAQAEMKKAGIFADKKRRAARGRYHTLCQEMAVETAKFEPVTDDFNRKANELNKIIDSCYEKLKITSPKKGSILRFGTDPLSSDKTPVEWIVIHENSEQIYLLSRYILGYGAFKENFDKIETYTAWLRSFENKAFTPDEKAVLCKSPITGSRESSYAFVYRYGDAKKYLGAYLKAEPSVALLDSVNSSNDKYDPYSFKKKDLLNVVSKSYWFHSKDSIAELNAYCAVVNENGAWETKMFTHVTNDSFRRGIRPGIILDRKKLVCLTDTVSIPDEGISSIQAQQPDEQELRRSLAEKYMADELKEDKKLKKVRIAVLTAVAAVLVSAAVGITASSVSKLSAYNEAVGYLDENEFEQAISAFNELGNYKDSEVMAIEAAYLSGFYELENKNFNNAKKIFKELDGYKDSAAMITESDYLCALYYMEDKAYNKAAEKFEKIADYKDSSALKTECEYLCALEELDSGDYEDAIELFSELSGYKDADKYLNEIVYLPVGICVGNSKKAEEIVMTEDGRMAAVHINGYSFIFDNSGVLTGYTVNGSEYRIDYAEDGTSISYRTEDNAPMSKFDMYGNITAHYRGTDMPQPITDYALDEHNNSTALLRENRYDKNGNLESAYYNRHQLFALKYEYIFLSGGDAEIYMRNIRMILELM